MKYNATALLFVICALFAFSSTLATSSSTQSSASTQTRTPVVVELFTSEGCSSCPPADAFLLRLEEQQFVDGAEVIAIEEHVDYWNHDGWTDPFSSVEWTLRQQDYASAFKLDGTYTPQIVIDGHEQFIGSRTREVSTAILQNSRNQKCGVSIEQVLAAQKQARQFDVSVTNLTGSTPRDSSEIWLAITEKGLHSKVDRGENAGKSLYHASVVRWMHKIAVANEKASPSPLIAQASVKLNPTWKIENLRAVAFVQERQSRRMLGAASVKLAR